MDRQTLLQAREWTRQELRRCINFWVAHGIDREHGGIYTCLDRKGAVYSTDKSVWMQGRCAWTFANLCGVYGVREQWLEIAKSCLDFLEEHCINRQAGNRMYFQVTADGKPLRQRRYCFSEGFYALANAEYFAVTGSQEHLERARGAYHLIHQLNNHLIADPTGLGAKVIPQTRSGRSLADPMIFLNLTNVLWRVDPTHREEYDRHAAQCADSILRYHVKADLGCTLETVGSNGEFWSDITVGRVVNPGHAIECSWFLMEYADRIGDLALHRQAEWMFTHAIEAGWDREYGGLLYVIDCLGKPPESYEHDMKLWWPHNEAAIAALMAYKHTGKQRYLQWFYKTLEYCKQHFSDPEYGEWYGYLRRDGKPTMPPAKGSTFKGPFHLPRMLIMTDSMLGEIVTMS